MNHRLLPQTTLSLACAILTSPLATADMPPDPFLGYRHLLSVKFNVSRPVTDTEAQFLAVRQLMNSIDDETAGPAEHHPEKDVSCDKCHAKDSVSVDHYGLTINESNPEKSCSKVGCHDLKVAGEMPFYVKPYAPLDETAKPKLIKQRLTAAKNLLQYTKTFKDNLLTRAAGLPTLNSFSIDIKAEDKKINNLTHDVPLSFFEPKTLFDIKKDADVLPIYASTGLASELFSLFGQDMSVATRLTGTLEARVAKADELEKHLSVLDDHAPINGLLTSSQLTLRYLSTLPVDSIDFVTNELAVSFPSAIATADTSTGDETTGTRRSKTWEIPASANDGINKATITLQLNTEGSRRQPSTQLQFQNLTADSRAFAVQLLKKFQDQYVSFNSDHARYTLSYQANTDTDKNLLTAAIQNSKAAASKGDLRRSLSNSENTTTGTVSASGLVTAGIDSIKATALENPAAIRRLRSNIRYKPDLTTVSQISNEALTSAMPRLSVSSAQQQLSEAGKEKIIFTVTRETATDKPLIVYFALAGSATAGKDYVKPKLSVKIPAGATSVNIPIKLKNNKLAEAEETLSLIILPSKKYNYTILNANAATIAILDDDAPKL